MRSEFTGEMYTGAGLKLQFELSVIHAWVHGMSGVYILHKYLTLLCSRSIPAKMCGQGRASCKAWNYVMAMQTWDSCSPGPLSDKRLIK